MKRGNLMQWGALAAVLCGMAGIGIWSARVTGPAQTSKVGRAEVPASARSERVSVPIAFAPNHGQASDEVRFTSTGAGCSLTLTAREAILAYRTAGQRGVFVGTELTPVSGPLPPRTAVQRMGWIGANPDPVVRAEEPLPGKMNYYRDSKSRHAVTNIPTYARVRYENLWPGIDLEYHGESGSLEYDFVVAPGADPSAIRLTFPGADRLALDSEGNLEVAASGAVAPHARPQLYQDQGGRRVAVEGRFAIRGPNEVGFEVGSYDRSARLVIDPVITYSRYLGDMLDIGSVHVDANGIWVVGGCASSIDPNPSDPLNPGIVGSTASEGLSLIRLDPTGATVLFQTNILDTGGGQLYVDNETPFGLDVDASGNAYIAGNTNTYSNPYVTSGRAILDGPLDVLVGRFDATGAITGMVLLGGNGTDGTAGAGTVVGMGDLKLDSSGNVWITTGSNSTDLSTLYPSVPGYDQTNHAFMEEVLFRLDPSSLGVTYWSFLGGNGGDRGMGIRFGTDGSIYVAGNTNSTDFPVTAGAFQTGPQGGLDFTITKLDPTGTSLVYSTYLGGSGTEGYLFPSGPALAVDEDGCAYFRGITTSADFPVVNAAQPTLAGGADATLSKLDATGQNLVYSTYLGGSGDELSTALVVDDRGNAYVSGYTYSNDFPTVNTSVGLGGPADGFLVKLDRNGARVASTYIGGSLYDGIQSIALDPLGEVILAGVTNSLDFPSAANTYAGYSAGFIARVASSCEITGTVTADCPAADTPLAGVTVDAFASGTNTLAGTAVTASDGNYAISDLGAGEYSVSVVAPLGYSTGMSDVLVDVLDGGSSSADFTMTCVASAGAVRGSGFWKHQIGVALGGNGNASIDAATICGYLDLVEAHFNDNAVNQVVVYDPPTSATCDDKLTTAAALLNLPGKTAMIDRARSQLFAMLLNAAAGYLPLQSVVSDDGATASQAITFCDNVIDNSYGNYTLAKDVAEIINSGASVPAGMIPLETANIAYRGPTLIQFAVGPSPAFGNRVFRFAMGRSARVALRVYDVHGRLVSRVFEGALDAGQHALGWNGRAQDGSSLSAGVYFARLSVGKEKLQTKLVQTTR